MSVRLDAIASGFSSLPGPPSVRIGRLSGGRNYWRTPYSVENQDGAFRTTEDLTMIVTELLFAILAIMLAVFFSVV